MSGIRADPSAKSRMLKLLSPHRHEGIILIGLMVSSKNYTLFWKCRDEGTRRILYIEVLQTPFCNAVRRQQNLQRLTVTRRCRCDHQATSTNGARITDAVVGSCNLEPGSIDPSFLHPGI